ncbi:MAG: VanZ family protein [Patescibacteria group bacterium]
MVLCKMMNKKFFKIFAVFLWLLVIILLSSVPGTDYPTGAFDYSVFAHLAEYFVLGFLIAGVFEKYTFKKFILSIIFCLLFGIFDEFYQSFVSFRDTDILDWVFDVAGSLIGIVACLHKKIK